jgi:hypothetical protein
MQNSVGRIRQNAAKCHELAETSITAAAREVLLSLARQHEEEALKLERHEESRQTRSAFDWELAQ